ncbi:MAG: hypothetical protein ABSE90_07585, partial [Verrucomicrobiota bacterium]
IFSHVVQDAGTSCVPCSADSQRDQLHPEWPTWKNGIGLLYRKYKKVGKKYRPVPRDSPGRAGFIDFAIGEYEKPVIGIEFSLKYGWSDEEIVFDLVKLLDCQLPFKTSISLNFVLREKGCARGGRLAKLAERMQKSVEEAKERLKDDFDWKRPTWFYVVEVSVTERNIWRLDEQKKAFVEDKADQ